jgi:8-oxo-dGTP diphosphatase
MKQPTITDSTGQRKFSCFPAGVGAFILDQQERILVLSPPSSPGSWEIVSGAVEAGETLLEGVLREIREELGEGIRVRPLGVLHAYTFPYDERAQYLVSVMWLFEYEGGEITPGDDMAGAVVRWVTAEEVERGELSIEVPTDLPWLFGRAVSLYRLLRDQPGVELQPAYVVPVSREMKSAPGARGE